MVPVQSESMRSVGCVNCVQDGVDLAGMIFEGAFGPDHEMGAGDFFSDWHLRGDAGFDLVWGPAARGEAFTAGGFRTGHTYHFIEMGGSICFKEQRDDHKGDGSIFVSPGFDLGKPTGANTRMQNVFELFAGYRVFKDDAGELVPAELAIGRNYFFAKNRANFIEGGLAWINEFAGEEVGVHDFCATLLEKGGSGGFTHAYTAGQTEKFHLSAILSLGNGIGNVGIVGLDISDG